MDGIASAATDTLALVAAAILLGFFLGRLSRGRRSSRSSRAVGAREAAQDVTQSAATIVALEQERDAALDIMAELVEQRDGLELQLREAEDAPEAEMDEEELAEIARLVHKISEQQQAIMNLEQVALEANRLTVDLEDRDARIAALERSLSADERADAVPIYSAGSSGAGAYSDSALR